MVSCPCLKASVGPLTHPGISPNPSCPTATCYVSRSHRRPAKFNHNGLQPFGGLRRSLERWKAEVFENSFRRGALQAVVTDPASDISQGSGPRVRWSNLVASVPEMFDKAHRRACSSLVERSQVIEENHRMIGRRWTETRALMTVVRLRGNSHVTICGLKHVILRVTRVAAPSRQVVRHLTIAPSDRCGRDSHE